MSEVIENCIRHCKTKNNKLVLPEGEDPRVQSAAIKIQELGIATPTLIGNADLISSTASEANNNLSTIDIIDTRQQVPKHLTKPAVRRLCSEHCTDQRTACRHCHYIGPKCS